MKFKNTARLFALPLWLLVLAWLIIGRRRAATNDDWLSLHQVLDDLFYALPVPATRFERLVVPRVIGWIRARQAELVDTPSGAAIGVLAK